MQINASYECLGTYVGLITWVQKNNKFPYAID
jgi:hypothetical protein